MDIFRLIAALLVIAIHTSPLLSVNADADFVLTRVLARIAVPFFLMATGFFVLPQQLFPQAAAWADASHHSPASASGANRTRDNGRLRRFLCKTLLLYLAATLLYLPVSLYAGHFKGAGLWDILRMLLFDGSFYHLWYLPAVLFGVPFLCLLGQRLPFRAVFCVSLFLYFLGLLGDSYYGLLSFVPVLQPLYDALFCVFSYTRNGIFYAPVFLAMGAALSPMHLHPASYGDSRQRSIPQAAPPGLYAAGFFTGLALMAAEGLALRHFQMQRHDSMYLALPPVLFFLFQWILSWQAQDASLRTVSALIYLLHPLFIILVRGVAKVLHLERLLIDTSPVHYLAVCASCAAASFCLERLVRLATAQVETFFSKRQDADTRRAGIEADGAGTYAQDSPGTERAWIEINCQNLRENVAALQSLLPAGCRLMAAVKADAYGHGAVLVSKELQHMGVDAFCTASAEEGVQLRKQGIRGEILVLGYTHPAQFERLRKYHLTQTIVDYKYAETLRQYGKKLKAHLKIDTGMHRLGERCEEIENIRKIFFMKNLTITGIYTHLCADTASASSDRSFTEQQTAAFYAIADSIHAWGFSPKMHLLASGGLLHYPHLAGDYARVGIALYGYLSSRSDLQDCPIPLRPVLSVKARVALCKDLLAGESAGYGMQYVAAKDERIAVLSIGYADGLPRALSHSLGSVLIGGRHAPIIGRVCMDQTIVDITGIPGVKAGDIAVIMGASGCHKTDNSASEKEAVAAMSAEITAYDLAEAQGTITNEILSRLGARLHRVAIHAAEAVS